jgi:hypothetical protein
LVGAQPQLNGYPRGDAGDVDEPIANCQVPHGAPAAKSGYYWLALVRLSEWIEERALARRSVDQQKRD